MFVGLADTPGEYCDRCVGDGIHKKVVLVFGLRALCQLHISCDHRVSGFLTHCAQLLFAVARIRPIVGKLFLERPPAPDDAPMVGKKPKEERKSKSLELFETTRLIPLSTLI